MKLKEKDYARLIAEAAIKNVSAKEFGRELWLSMYQNKSLSKLERIFELAHEIAADKSGSVIAHIISVTELSDSQRKEIEIELGRRFKKIILPDYLVDSSLGTGVKVVIKDKIIDLSSKNQIERLNNHLKR